MATNGGAAAFIRAHLPRRTACSQGQQGHGLHIHSVWKRSVCSLFGLFSCFLIPILYVFMPFFNMFSKHCYPVILHIYFNGGKMAAAPPSCCRRSWGHPGAGTYGHLRERLRKIMIKDPSVRVLIEKQPKLAESRPCKQGQKAIFLLALRNFVIGENGQILRKRRKGGVLPR